MSPELNQIPNLQTFGFLMKLVRLSPISLLGAGQIFAHLSGAFIAVAVEAL